MEYQFRKFKAEGYVDIPSSKSYTHRALILAFILDKSFLITSVNFSEDVNATLRCLTALGGIFEVKDKTIKYLGKKIRSDEIVLNVNESGSTLRFLIPLAMALYDKVTFKGKESLFTRPLSIYEEIFDKQNIKYEKSKDSLTVYSKLKDEEFSVLGNISSQFISGLIFYKLMIKSHLPLKIIPPISSLNYINITLDMLNKVGIEYEFKNNSFSYQSTSSLIEEYEVERDYSQLAFFAVKAALDSKIYFKGFNLDSYQGDKKILDILRLTGAKIEYHDSEIVVEHQDLHPIEYDIDECIDLGPIVFVLCSFINGKSIIKGVERLKIKESNRLDKMIEELSKAGVEFNVLDNEVEIIGKCSFKGDYIFQTHKDHRIMMALSVFSSIVDGNCVVNGIECVRKSYPDFISDFIKLGGGKI